MRDNSVGWEVVCPDGRVRYLPYHNAGDAEGHARLASDEARFVRRDNCRLAPKPGTLERAQPPCRGGVHTTRPVLLARTHAARGEA